MTEREQERRIISINNMNRRNFLAIIPSLSAIPFIGNDMVKEKDKIILFNPTPKIIPSVPQEWDFSKLSCRLYMNDKQIADAYVTSFNTMPMMIETTARDNNSAMAMVRGAMEYTFECIVNGPITL